MEEKNVVKFKKNEFAMKEFIRKYLGKGKISRVRIEYVPMGEKIIITTNKPGLIIGREGKKIEELTRKLKKKFSLENPYIGLEEITRPEFDAQVIADDLAFSLEKMGPLKFKVVAYRTLQKIIDAGALGVEIIIGGKVPSSRAKSWRFARGYLKKTGDSSRLVDRAEAIAKTKPGIVGIKVGILSPDVKLIDKLIVDKELVESIKKNIEEKIPEKKLKIKKK